MLTFYGMLLLLQVDPLDATREFTRGVFSSVTTLIGISVDNRPVAGTRFQGTRKNTPRSLVILAQAPKGTLVPCCSVVCFLHAVAHHLARCFFALGPNIAVTSMQV